MSDKEKKVVFLMNKYSIVVKGIEKRMEAAGYKTEAITEEYEDIMLYATEPCVFILYKPEEFLSEGGVNFRIIQKMIIEYECDMIIIGDSAEEKSIKHQYPKMDKFRWVLLPVDFEKLSVVVKETFKSQEDRNQNGGKNTGAQDGANTGAGKPVAKKSSGDDAMKSVLIVDDDPSYGGVIRQWLKDKYHVFMVTAGVQAIALLAKNKVDLILLDYEMPVVDGPQVLQMLRQDDETADIPVVFLTGVSSSEGVKRVLELKPAGYLLKSASREDILAYIKSKIGE